MKMQIRSGSLPVGSRTTDGSGRSAKKKKKADTKSSSSPSLSSKKNEFVPSFREAMKVKVKIIDIDIVLKKKFYGVVDMSFSSRRKNIRNNLKKVGFNWDELEIDSNLRPEEVSLEEYLKLAKALKQ